MRKYLWIAVIALLACAVYFTSCERVPKMMEPLLPDAEQVEPIEPESTEMMEMPVDLVDVMVYTGSTWWIEQMDAATEAETLKSLLEPEGIQAVITEDENVVRDWMLGTTGNSAVNVLILYGVLPHSIYAAGNTQPDGSIAENWLETSDGDTILNHADYIGYQSTPDPENRRGHLAGESNRHGGLQNLMDIPNIVIPFSNGVSMTVAEDGMALTPSLGDFTSNRFMPLNQLQGDWFAEKVFASDTGDDLATYADPVIVRDGNHGRIAIVYATSGLGNLPNEKVAAEVIINYLLAPPMMATVEPPAEPMVRMEMPELPPEMVELKKLYWGDSGSGLIQRSNPDGSNVETLIRGVKPWGIELDIEGGKIYWVSWVNQRLSRANLDGSNVEVLVAGETFQELAIDLEAGKIYWSGSGKIQRANLDGSEVEDIITTSFYPDGIALDLVNGKIYWTEWTEFPPNPDELTDTIQRANLDGSDIEVLVTGLLVPQAITLDIDGGKIYWTNWPPVDTIQRANLDGTNIEDVLPGSGGLHDIVFDFSEGKFYWADTSTTYIQRANVDGSEIEEVVAGLVSPRTVALDIGPIN